MARGGTGDGVGMAPSVRKRGCHRGKSYGGGRVSMPKWGWGRLIPGEGGGPGGMSIDRRCVAARCRHNLHGKRRGSEDAQRRAKGPG